MRSSHLLRAAVDINKQIKSLWVQCSNLESKSSNGGKWKTIYSPFRFQKQNTSCLCLELSRKNINNIKIVSLPNPVPYMRDWWFYLDSRMYGRYSSNCWVVILFESNLLGKRKQTIKSRRLLWNCSIYARGYFFTLSKRCPGNHQGCRRSFSIRCCSFFPARECPL